MTRGVDEIIRAIGGPILVTGAGGFVGAALYKRIARVRSDVFGVVRNLSPVRLVGSNSKSLRVADLTDFSEVSNLFDEISPRTIFHLAAYGAYPGQQSLSQIFRVNVVGTSNLVEIASRRSQVTLINAGTSSEYGINCSRPDENATLIPNSYYAASKASTSSLLKVAFELGDLRSANLRLYSVYGPLENTSRLVPNAVREALNGRFPPFVEKQITRDFVYIDDVLEAFFLAALKVSDQDFSGDLNIGTGIPTTLEEFARTLKDVFGVVGEPYFGTMNNRAWDLPRWYANPERARTLLNWSSTTSLETGLLLTAKWISDMSEKDWKELGHVG